MVARDPGELRVQPVAKFGHQRRAEFLADGEALGRTLTIDIALDGEQGIELLHGLECDRTRWIRRTVTGYAQRLTLLSIFDFLIMRILDQIGTPPWKGCVVFSFKCSSIFAAALICASIAKAREVELVRFSPIGVADSDEQGTVGDALSAHFDRLAESGDAPGISQGTYATGGNRLSDVFELTPQGISAPSTPLLCPQNGYRPTWWLAPEVENNRRPIRDPSPRS